jgi:hypothetical protein
MKYVVVVPYAYQPYFDEFIKTVKIPRENMLLIDNTDPEKNIGIMAAHNRGIDFMKERGADWLIVMSAAIRFGEEGGLDFLKVLEEHPGYHVIHGASANVKGGKQANPDGGGGNNKVFGWHLAAFNRTVFEAIGRWDENFTPYGFDDIDLSLRIRKHFKEQTKWDTYPCDVTDTTMSHSIQLAGVKAPSAPRMFYFMEKWGRHPGAWQWDGWDHPFNNPEHSLAYWPPAPNGGKYDD